MESQSTLSEIVWIRKGNPEKVLVEKDKPSLFLLEMGSL
jgi:hypothetical protein